MSALVLFAALAAQTAAPPATTTSPPADETTGPKAGEQTYVDLEAGVGYSTNPFLSQDSHGRAYGRVAAHAVHTRFTARTSTVLSAYAENVSYTSLYNSQQSVSVSASHDAAVNEHLRLFGDLNASYTEGGQLDTRILSIPGLPPLPGSINVPPELLPPGSDFLTVTGRNYYLSAHGGGALSLSPRDSLSFTSGVERAIFRSTFEDTDYWSIPVSVGYDRRISERATVGGRLSYVKTDYNGPASFSTLSPQLTARVLLSENLTFSGAAGVSFSSVDDGIRKRHSTGLAASGTLCKVGEQTQFCARAAVDQSIATAAGPSKSVSAGIDYSRRLNADSTVQFSLDATHYSTPISIVAGQTFSRANYYRAAGSYARRIGTRLFAGVNVAARKLSQSGPDPDADFNASVFIRYRFGDVQ
jgi:hypothetical protein